MPRSETPEVRLTLGAPGPHHGQPVYARGPRFDAARGACILLHGRGATADDILQLADPLRVDGIAYLAPQAVDFTWYPNRFLAPLVSNEPWLGSALANVDDLVAQLQRLGIAPERIAIGGFSQGACLALEYIARYPRRHGGAIGWSGGLIGPPGTRWPIDGSLGGTPVFLGCSDVDAHIPALRVQESADALTEAGADVTMVLYPGMGHTINADEIAHAGRILRMLADSPAA
jgi:predicted esterase